MNSSSYCLSWEGHPPLSWLSWDSWSSHSQLFYSSPSSCNSHVVSPLRLKPHKQFHHLLCVIFPLTFVVLRSAWNYLMVLRLVHWWIYSSSILQWVPRSLNGRIDELWKQRRRQHCCQRWRAQHPHHFVGWNIEGASWKQKHESQQYGQS